jgi:multidrug efflux pump subunit AcrB
MGDIAAIVIIAVGVVVMIAYIALMLIRTSIACRENTRLTFPTWTLPKGTSLTKKDRQLLRSLRLICTVGIVVIVLSIGIRILVARLFVS